MEQELKRRRLIATHLKGKIRELHFYLKAVVAGCDASRAELHGPHQREQEDAVAFGFSALANAVQSIKDTLGAILDVPFAWSKVEAARHGKFVHHIRNAMTHDGHPVVTGWVDGRFFVPGVILRLDQRGHLVTIEPPAVDVRSMCLEFTVDFCHVVRAELVEIQEDPTLQGAPFDADEAIDAILNFSHLPDYAKELITASRDVLQKHIESERFNPVADAIGVVDQLIEYCEAQLRRPEFAV